MILDAKCRYIAKIELGIRNAEQPKKNEIPIFHPNIKPINKNTTDMIH